MMKDNIQTISTPTFPKPKKIKGHTTIILTDPKTGKQEIHEDDNMVTNALSKMFENCGLMNYPNTDRDNLVPQLLGGIMGFDTAITESADTIFSPAGAEMIFNGSILNSQIDANVTELGQYVAQGSGWQEDGSYVLTFDYTMEQANCKTGHPISCVCLTGREYGLIGEGNSLSGLVRAAGKIGITNLQGSQTSWSGYVGNVFKIDFENSCCYALDLTNRAEGTLTLRKYNVPITEYRMNSTSSSPVVLDTIEIDISSDTDLTSTTQVYITQSCAEKCLVWDMPLRTDSGYGPNKYWGQNFTQHLWTVTSDGTITKETITNATGNSELQGLGAAYFLGDNWCIFPQTLTVPSPNYAYWQQRTNTAKVYLWDRVNDTMVEIDNPYGSLVVNSSNISSGTIDYWNNVSQFWCMVHCVDGKAQIVNAYPSTGTMDTGYVIDCVNETIYPTNTGSNYNLSPRYPVHNLITHNNGGVNLYRNQCYIATVNNLATPIMKDATRTMRVIYRLTFIDEEEGTSN